MKQGKLFWGTLLLVTGILGLLNEFGVKFHFGLNSDIIIPILLVLLGLTFLVKDMKYKTVIIIVAAIISSTMIYSYIWDENYGDDSLFKFNVKVEDDKSDEDNSTVDENNHISKIPYYKLDELKLKLITAASELSLKGISSDEYTAKIRGKNFDSSFEESNSSGKLKIIHQKGESHSLKLKALKVLVNSKPIYSIEIKSAASELKLDLRDLKVKEIKGEIAATDAEIKFGEQLNEMEAEFKFAASELTLYIPKNSGCTIKSELALVDENLIGFSIIDDKTYRTKNFDNAVNKININIKGVLSGFEVIFY